MKIKTNKLTDAALDWAVVYIQTYKATDGKPVLTEDLMRRAVKNGMASPSTDWAQGGPIIEREKIDLNHYRLADKTAMWEASGSIGAKGAGYRYAVGPTPLIAAMRCYVASKLGDELEIPNELIGE